MRGFLLLMALGCAHSLRIPVRSSTQLHSCTRRSLVAGAALAAFSPLKAMANTEPMLDKPMAGFDVDAEKREAFKKKQKEYKKAWRKELANLEFASDDKEAIASINGLYRLINQNGLEIPEGVRKMDLDQVWANALAAKPVISQRLMTAVNAVQNRPGLCLLPVSLVSPTASSIQVYKTVQPKLGKEARMDFQKLDLLVRDITSVKNLSAGEQVQ